jgi:hypothetical protein
MPMFCPPAARSGRESVPEQLVVRDRQRLEHQLPARCVGADRVAEEGQHHRLVERHPHPYPVAEPRADNRCVVGEAVGGVAAEPAAGVLDDLRGVPVVEGRGGGDTGRAQLVDEPVVEVQPRLVDLAPAGRQHPRPGDREPVGAHAEVPHQRDVLAVAVVVVGGHRTGVAAQHGVRPGAEGVPSRRSATVLVDRALDLVGRRRDAPQEPFGERGDGGGRHRWRSSGRGLGSEPTELGLCHPNGQDSVRRATTETRAKS